MKHFPQFLFLIPTAALVGCAGQLVVFDEKQMEIKGIPFRTAEVYVKTGEYIKHSKGGACSKAPFVDTASLPTGAQYYVTAKSAQFAKTAFHIKFADNGAVAEIGLDSEPAAADTLKATNDLIKSVYSAIGGAPAAPAAAGGGGAAVPTFQACDAGESNVKFVKMSDYVRDQGK